MRQLFTLCFFVFTVFTTKAQFTFTPQIDVGYSLMDLNKTNGFLLGLGVKTGYIIKKEHRIAVSGAYDYLFGKKNSTTGSKYEGMALMPFKLNYAFPILHGKNDTWYIEPNVGYAIFGGKSTKYKGVVGGINFGTFDTDTDLNIGLEVAKLNGLNGLYGNISLRFGFLDMFSSHDTYSTQPESIIIRKAD